MTEWSVVGVIIALCGLVATLVRPMLSLNGSITKLSVLAERLGEDLGALAAKNSENHAKLWDKNESQDRQIEDHECRITALEKGGM